MLEKVYSRVIPACDGLARLGNRFDILGCFKGLLYKKIEPATAETAVDIYKLSKGVRRTVEEIYQILSVDNTLYLTQAQIKKFLADTDWRPIQRQNMLFLVRWGVRGMILRMKCGIYGPYFEMSGLTECGSNWRLERDDEINQQYYFVVVPTTPSQTDLLR